MVEAPITQRVPTEAIRFQPDAHRGCGYYAAQNLYLSAGLEPPTVDEMHRVVASAVPVRDDDSLTPADLMALLCLLRFPAMFALGIVPAGKSARDVLPQLLDAGCLLLVVFSYLRGDHLLNHAVVAESWSDAGLHVLCSSGEWNEGIAVAWQYPPLQHRPPTPSHGCRMIVPWETSDYEATWDGVGAVGINRMFICIVPS
jgi:hypothetical protein